MEAASPGAGPGLAGVHRSLDNLLSTGLEAFSPEPSPTAARAHEDEPFGDELATPRSVFASAKYFRVVAPGLALTEEADPSSEAAGELAAGEVLEVLQTLTWEDPGGLATRSRMRVARGWVSAFDDAGTPTLERMQVAMQEVRSRSWSEQKSRPQPAAGGAGPLARAASASASASDDEAGDAGADAASAAPSGQGAAADLVAPGPPMLLGEWDPASAPSYAVPPDVEKVQVRAFVGLTSRRCGVLHAGEVVQAIETQTNGGATRLRFRGGWVTLLEPRGDGGFVSTMEWTRDPPTKLSAFRDAELLATLAENGRQERAAAQLRKRQEREELARGYTDGAGAPGRQAGQAVAPLVITGLEPEELSAAIAARTVQPGLAKLYSGEGGAVDVREIGHPRTPRSATTGAPAYRSYTFQVFDRTSGVPIARFSQRYSTAKAIHDEMKAIGMDMAGCVSPPQHALRDMVDDEDNVAKRGAHLERYYHTLFGLHWTRGAHRSVELLKEMLGTVCCPRPPPTCSRPPLLGLQRGPCPQELVRPAPHRPDEEVAASASKFYSVSPVVSPAVAAFWAADTVQTGEN